MQVSVITPVKDDPRLRRTIDSVQAQRFSGEIEHIVVDGGSSGETATVLNERGDDIDVLISEPDDGVFDAMNKGIDVARGNIVAILNADDRWQSNDVLRVVAETFERHAPEAVYGDKLLVDANDRIIRHWRAGRHALWRWHFGWMPPHPTFFVRRTVYERYGTFDLNYKYSADYEFMLRTIRKHGIRVRYIPRVLTRFELGGRSNASIADIIAANREVRRAWRENELPGGALVPLLKPGRKLGQYLRAFLLRHDEA